MATIKDVQYYVTQEFLTEEVMNRPLQDLDENIRNVNTHLEELLDDEIISEENGWSSYKINQVISNLSLDFIDDNVISPSLGWSSQKINSLIGQGGGASFDDAAISQITGWTSFKINSELGKILNDSVTSLNSGWSSQKISNFVLANSGGGVGDFPYWNLKEDFGAVGDGTTDDSIAFQTAYSTANDGDVIVVPRGNYKVTSFPVGNDKYVVWWTEGAYQEDGVTPIGGEYTRDSEEVGQGFQYSPTLPGLTKTSGTFKAIGKKTEEVLIKTTTSPDELTNTRFVRVAEHTGGTGVATCVDVRTKVGPDNTNFEWGLMSLVDNYSTDPTGGNTAINGFIHKYANSPSWGGQFVAVDYSVVPDAGVNGVEIDISANGADPTQQRILAQLVGFKRDDIGEKCEIGKGILIASYDFDTAKVTFGTGIELKSEFNIGIDLFNSTFNESVIRIGSQKNIDFSANGDNTRILRHSPGIAEDAFVFRGSWIRPEGGISFFYTTVPTAIRLKTSQKINFGGDDERTISHLAVTDELVIDGCRLRPDDGINFMNTTLGEDAIKFKDSQGITFGNSSDAELFYNGSINQMVVKGRRLYTTHGIAMPSGNGNTSSSASNGIYPVPNNCAGYIVIPIDGINRKVPFFN